MARARASSETPVGTASIGTSRMSNSSMEPATVMPISFASAAAQQHAAANSTSTQCAKGFSRSGCGSDMPSMSSSPDMVSAELEPVWLDPASCRPYCCWQEGSTKSSRLLTAVTKATRPSSANAADSSSACPTMPATASQCTGCSANSTAASTASRWQRLDMRPHCTSHIAPSVFSRSSAMPACTSSVDARLLLLPLRTTVCCFLLGPEATRPACCACSSCAERAIWFEMSISSICPLLCILRPTRTTASSYARQYTR
mmetsp:Transcript_23101/g.59198  ORF Transcript_23101/g.59198 Transcript_23101/m.59198 type:complete len:258 (-) Transcript_23101:309-1082(-)